MTVPERGLSSAVGEFLAAYLTGAGRVDRYLAPGVNLTAVSPGPYTAVAVQQVSAIEEAAATDQVPADGVSRLSAGAEGHAHWLPSGHLR
ncbi:hypothetical protein [Streptomyces sp. NPDC092129]|uniref:hypothetical protein n=1 Tax=Streptomyces sp. NPDC092129 TaxID=3366010 RepID=UPI00381DC414